MLVRPRQKTHSMLENKGGEDMKKTSLFNSRHVRVQGTKQIMQRFSGERRERTTVRKGWVFGFTKRGSLRCRYPRKKGNNYETNMRRSNLFVEVFCHLLYVCIAWRCWRWVSNTVLHRHPASFSRLFHPSPITKLLHEFACQKTQQRKRHFLERPLAVIGISVIVAEVIAVVEVVLGVVVTRV